MHLLGDFVSVHEFDCSCFGLHTRVGDLATPDSVGRSRLHEWFAERKNHVTAIGFSPLHVVP